MRYSSFFISIWIFSINCTPIYHSSDATKECKVKLATINDTYEGFCKNGLAHGQGIAEGLHTYEGDFIAGLPDGEGIYTWHKDRIHTGTWKKGTQYSFGTLNYVEDGINQTISGYWYDGKLEVLANEDTPYKIVSERGVVSSNIRRQGINYSGKVLMRFRRNGENVQNIISDLSFSHSSGNMPNQPGSNSTLDYTIEDVNYPLELSVYYKIPNLMNTSLIDNRVRIIITEPGQYVIDFNNS